MRKTFAVLSSIAIMGLLGSSVFAMTSTPVPGASFAPAPTTAPSTLSASPVPALSPYLPLPQPSPMRSGVKKSLPAFAIPNGSVLSSRKLLEEGRLPRSLTGVFAYVDEYHINNRGQVVMGRILWTNGATKVLPNLPGGAGVWARDINDVGHVVGRALPTDEDDGDAHAFWWDGRRMRDIGAVLGRRTASEALDINNASQIVGNYIGRDGYQRAVLWEKGRVRELGRLSPRFVSHSAVAINDRGQIVGTASTEDGYQQAFIWEKGRMRALNAPDALGTTAVDINDRGQIVGGQYAFPDENGSIRSYVVVWDAGKARPLKVEGNAYAINNKGQVVGTVVRGSQEQSFLWEAGGHVLIDDYLAPKNRLGGITQAALNDNGSIVANNTLVELPPNMPPTLSILEPIISTFISSQPDSYPATVSIRWRDGDLDSNARISFYYYREDSSEQASLIVEDITEDDARNEYSWNVSNLPAGTYHIFGVIDDGTNPAMKVLGDSWAESFLLDLSYQKII